ncbi:hypothetical protein Kpol_1018p67 [Vanderwaltozyma polyspora DSM 70294]|uniref:Uncharacterized protein n=1 Tax=Vanderwaltozyma polyspora (strain ATCC 22028 / DSM 70294 / BCRC 21397 / CBS 2163 / NBRC 10782 / NRRL Y-8283 / UCD 57-17) TaxID=436907 RepID=A7TDR5_VANPO|nr:uncharacterized protein Kpol_1018p67 [Vanderwaltozyma polyspora DSM 70294]EDO19535.1 hypothetical protein Kpol_1018p67 [Vanderwaltozyma polyspora DSM 70294]
MVNRSDFVEIVDCPPDYISQVLFLEGLSKLVVTSWDGSLSIYDYRDRNNVVLEVRLVHDTAITCCTESMIDNERCLYVGTVQGEVLKVELSNGTFIPVSGSLCNELGICGIFSTRQGQVITCSWDGYIQVINVLTNSMVKMVKIDKKILVSDFDGERLILATSGNKIVTFDIPLSTDDKGNEVESGLKYQIRDIKITPQHDAYVSCSVDGRVAVEYFNDDTKKFAFRCHRISLSDSQFVFPVNSLCFVPNSNILYTGGSDGCMSCWNLTSRKKIEQLPKFDENSIVETVCNGDVLCVATSDDSFKTNPAIFKNIELNPSKLYLLYL